MDEMISKKTIVLLAQIRENRWGGWVVVRCALTWVLPPFVSLKEKALLDSVMSINISSLRLDLKGSFPSPSFTDVETLKGTKGDNLPLYFEGN